MNDQLRERLRKGCRSVALDMDVQAERLQDLDGVVGGRSVGAVDAVEATPQGIQVREGVTLGELVDNPMTGVVGEGGHERRQVHDVVEHMGADNDVGGRNRGRDVGPPPLDDLGNEAERRRALRQFFEH